MKKKKMILIIIFSILGIGLLVFLLMGVLRKDNQEGNGMQPLMQRIPPVKINYPKIEENKQYKDRIFDTSYVHEVNIIISNKDWEDLKKYPTAKRKYPVDITIDGIKLKNVSFNTKGNSSLKSIAEGPSVGPAANRFSFKINFGKYENNQTYYGLDILNLNNIFGDASYLNDALSYEMFREMGIAAPLTSFVYLKINGQNFGLYSAVEEISKSFMERNNLDGYLYKPGQSGRNNKGSTLIYVDEKIDSYPDIFNNAKSIISKDDKTRLIKSLKYLNEQKDLDKVLNIKEIIPYFAVHNFLLSYDSYTGKSIHNYYLLEKDGILSMLPWDYNLAFGRFNMPLNITDIINYGIDSPLIEELDKNRPMWNWIKTNPIYLEEYHQTINKLIKNFYESGKLDKYIDNNYQVIKSFIPLDISAFYNINQVEEAIETLKEFCKYRVQSIKLQLNGKLSTITKNQLEKEKIDASKIDLEKLGFVADDSKREQQESNSSNSEPHLDKRNNTKKETTS